MDKLDQQKREHRSSLQPRPLLILLTILLAGSLAYHTDFSTVHARTSPTGLIKTLLTAPSGASFDYMVTILMENDGYCDIITTCGGLGPYETGLASNYSLAGLCTSDSLCSKGGYTAVSHPSEPNYCALFGAEYVNCATDDGVCCFQDTGPNLVDRLESAGLKWKAFAEDAAGSGTCGFSPPSNSNHFPFLNFKDMNTTARCANFVTATSPSDSEFLTILNQASSWPNYLWLTPTNDDNGHSSGAAAGDSYLSSLVPKILASALFQTQRAALFIVYDEGPSSYTYPYDYIYASWSGPVVKAHYIGTGSYSHYSYARTLESNWGLTSLTTNDASANAMTEFFSSTGPSPVSTSFTFTPSNPLVAQNVSFTALASGGVSPYTYSWKFGDGSSGSGQTASHAYATQGQYTVLLTTTDSLFHQALASRSLTVYASLSAGFNYSPSSPQSGQPISFTAIVSGGIAPYSYQWGFGDGSNATVSSPSHAYASTGNFTVTLAVKDSASPQQTTVSHQTITVSTPSSGLTTSFTFTPALPQTSQTITFTGKATGGTGAYTFSWSFGDGSRGGPGSSVTHTYASAGTFTVILTVTDSAHPHPGTAMSQQSITISNPPPPLTASFVAVPSASIEGTNVTFTPSVTGGTVPYSYQWSFGDGSTSVASSPGHSYATPGTFTVILFVKDSGSPQQTATSQKTVSVTSPPPLAASFSFTPSSLLVGQHVTFTGSATGGTSPYTYSWAFDDGSTGTGSTVTHSYASVGTFTVALTVKDSTSPQQTATSQQSITVSATLTALTASFTYSPSSLQVGQAVSFTGSASGGTSPYTFSWSFGDGSSGTGSSATHIYQTAGSYEIVLSVNDSSTPQKATGSRQTTTVANPSGPPTQPSSSQPAAPPSLPTIGLGLAVAAGIAASVGVLLGYRRRSQRLRNPYQRP